ncbi:MAG: hypothetical protein R3301_03080 [Saprospiraceae bacterium]|nr:hypothetical protein [Saprospiraceae bacterium]
MSRQIYLTMLVLFLALVTGRAQDAPKTIDILTTVNGSIWKGTIQSWDAEKVVFETLNGVRVEFRTTDVTRVRQRLVGAQRVPKPYAFKEEGTYQVVQFATSGGFDAGISVTYAIGHRFSRMLGVGVGVGFENFELDEGKHIYPVFAEVRGFFREKKLSPYYAGRIGYGFATGDEELGVAEAKGGFLGNAELGIRFGGSEKVNFYAGIGAHFQKATYRIDWPWNEDRIIDRVWYQRTELKFGIVF